MKHTTFTFYFDNFKGSIKITIFQCEMYYRRSWNHSGRERERDIKEGGAIISSYGWLWTFMAPATDFQTHG